MSRVVFFGSPEFAVPSLEALIHSDYKPLLVVTQPDRPAGRGKNRKPTAVREAAENSSIPVRVVGSFKEGTIVEELEKLDPDFFVVVAFGLIFPGRVLSIPARESVNVHASLLPAYRGASPVNMAVVNGDLFTGISTMRMERKLDAGPIFLQEAVPIGPMESAGELSPRLASKGAELLVRTLREIERGLSPSPQPEEGVSIAPILSKEDGLIPWQKSVFDVHNHIRGMNPWPGSHTYHKGKIIKVHESIPCTTVDTGAAAGTVTRADGKDIIVACGSGSIRIDRLQAAGRKALGADEFLRGYRLHPGEAFREK